MARLDVALPSAFSFVFGAAVGLVVGWLAATGGQTDPHGGDGAQASAAGSGAPAAADAAAREVQLRETLAMHEQLLADQPDNARLQRTVGEYQAMLGEYEPALARYERAEELARGAGDDEELAQVLVDRGLAEAELGRFEQSLAHLAEAADMRPEDVTPRLVQAYLYLTRIMPSPPPGFDRREAVTRAEELLDEVLSLEPGNADARRFKDLIESVRRSRSEEGAPAPAGP